MRNRSLRTVLSWIAGLAIVALAGGCSPKVYTKIQKSYPARAQTATILFYDVGAEVPASAEVLGNVTVKDTGFSLGCTFEQVLRLAIAETNKAGGNGFSLIYHRLPNALGSSCHRISGNMLLIPDSLPLPEEITTVALSPDTAASNNNTGFSEKLETSKEANPAKKHPWETTVFINAGYAFIASEYLTPEGSRGNPRSGLDINAGMHFISPHGLGVGMRYSGYFSSFELPVDDMFYKDRITLHYAGPEFVLRQNIRKWILQFYIGLGYVRYIEQAGDLKISFGGFGANLGAGFGYKLSKNISIGAELNINSMRFSSRYKELVMPDSDSKKQLGVNRVSYNGGVQFHF